MISSISALEMYPAVSVQRPFFAFETSRVPVNWHMGSLQPALASLKLRP